MIDTQRDMRVLREYQPRVLQTIDWHAVLAHVNRSQLARIESTALQYAHADHWAQMNADDVHRLPVSVWRAITVPQLQVHASAGQMDVSRV